MTRILNVDDLDWAKREIIHGNEQYNLYAEGYETLIKSFENQEIVETFFASGNFGKDKQEKIKEIKVLLDEAKIMIDNLASSTNSHLDEQIDLNSNLGGIY